MIRRSRKPVRFIVVYAFVREASGLEPVIGPGTDGTYCVAHFGDCTLACIIHEGRESVIDGLA